MRSMTSLVGSAKSLDALLQNPDSSGFAKAGRLAYITAGEIFGLPTTQADRILQGLLYDIDQGSANPLPPLFGPPSH